MPYLKTQQVNFLGILSEWGPDPLRPLPNFYLSDFYFFFFSKILGISFGIYGAAYLGIWCSALFCI